ncbi:MAG: hypothetical protein BA863_02175 [Desulfovibrio sp. S3730MH75]|nr:MAG: hypothetical protein BA863_02175 [Desulfovibrio sp. S3730MH75]
MNDRILKGLKEISEELRCGEKEVSRLISVGRLPVFELAGAYRIRRETLLRWVDDQTLLVKKKIA